MPGFDGTVAEDSHFLQELETMEKATCTYKVLITFTKEIMNALLTIQETKLQPFPIHLN